MFVNLNTHSYYSLLISSISIDDIISYSEKNNLKYASLIDINNMYGVMEFYTKCLEHDIKPIIGLQVQHENSNLLLVAKNYHGYLALCKISSSIMHNEQFDLTKFVDDNLIIICNNSKQFKVSDIYEFNDIAINECLFVSENDYEKYKALIAIRDGKLLSEVEDDKNLKNKFMFSQQQAQDFFSKKQLANLEELISKIDINLPLNKNNYFVKFDKKYASNILLEERCRQGLLKRFKDGKVQKKYIDRIKYELDVIDQMGFEDYFLVVQDYVMFAKNNNILIGPGRGSAAGSLVSYVLEITDLDPIKNNLLFERFLNVERKSKPDIDIDFMDSQRQEVIDYIFDKYGKDHVAHIITFQRIKAKTAIRDAGRVLDIDLKTINWITKNIPFVFDMDLKRAIDEIKELKEMYAKYSELFDLAMYLVDLPRQIGTHAAGIVICDKRIDEVIPTCLSVEGTNTTQYSMEYIEMNGLIKMDILGLINLSIIDSCLKFIQLNSSKLIDLEKIDYSDQKVFGELSKGNTTGIFQLESPGMTGVVVKIKPKSIEDISIASALFRPGPQENIPEYLKNKEHPEIIKYVNQDLKPILEPTYGIIIYQEQVMEMVRKVANYSYSQADIFRRAISKKEQHVLIKASNEFIDAAIKNGYSEKDAKQISNYIFKFANYGFNHSHSLAYSYISYQMAYLKTYYPLEFYCCLLTYMGGSAGKMTTYIEEAKRKGLKILQPDINNSISGFKIYNKSILFGLSTIKGIGFETIKKIIDARNELENKKFDNVLHAIQILSSKSIGEKAIEALVKAGSFDVLFDKQFNSRSYILKNLSEIYLGLKSYSKKFGMLKQIEYVDVEMTPELFNKENSDQLELIDISFAEHPIKTIKDANNFKNHKLVNLKDVETSNDEVNFVYSLVCVGRVKRIVTKNNTPMAFVTLEDESGSIDAHAFNNILSDDKLNKLLQKDKILIVKLLKTSRGVRMLNIMEEVK